MKQGKKFDFVCKVCGGRELVMVQEETEVKVRPVLDIQIDYDQGRYLPQLDESKVEESTYDRNHFECATCRMSFGTDETPKFFTEEM